MQEARSRYQRVEPSAEERSCWPLRLPLSWLGLFWEGLSANPNDLEHIGENKLDIYIYNNIKNSF